MWTACFTGKAADVSMRDPCCSRAKQRCLIARIKVPQFVFRQNAALFFGCLAGNLPNPASGSLRQSVATLARTARLFATGKITTKKRRLSPSYRGDLAGNRTRDCAVRGRRLNLLTTRPWLLTEKIITYKIISCNRFSFVFKKFFSVPRRIG